MKHQDQDSQLQQLEQRLREVRLAPLPADLRTRLADNPSSKTTRRGVPIIWGGAAFACAAALAFLFVRADFVTPKEDTDPEVQPLTIVQKDSTLLNSRPLSIEEHDGQLWELVEEEWRDDTLVMCSTSPLEVRSSTTRRALVLQPISFQ